MGFKMNGFSAFTKNGNVQQDIVKTKEAQTKDLNKDIDMLLKKGASKNDERIISIRKEIERLNKKKE